MLRFDVEYVKDVNRFIGEEEASSANDQVKRIGGRQLEVESPDLMEPKIG